MTQALPYWFDAALFCAMAFAILQLTTLGRNLMATQADIDNLTAQVGKIHAEVNRAKDQLVAELTSVHAQLAAAGAADKVDISGLQTAIQTLDDINPDVPAELPEEVPAEVPAEEPAEDVVEEVVEEVVDPDA